MMLVRSLIVVLAVAVTCGVESHDRHGTKSYRRAGLFASQPTAHKRIRARKNGHHAPKLTERQQFELDKQRLFQAQRDLQQERKAVEERLALWGNMESIMNNLVFNIKEKGKRLDLIRKHLSMLKALKMSMTSKSRGAFDGIDPKTRGLLSRFGAALNPRNWIGRRKAGGVDYPQPAH